MLIFAGKRALFDRLAVLQGSDARLSDVQVSYSYPGEPDQKLIYGLSGKFTRVPSTAEYTSLQHDEALIELVVQVYLEGDDGREGETTCEDMANAIAEDLAVNPKGAGSLTWTGVVSGDVTYVDRATPEPSVTTFLHLYIGVSGHTT